MVVQDDRRGELNILVRGRHTDDEVRKEDEGYGGGEMGKDGWDEIFTEMNAPFYTLPTISRLQEHHLMTLHGCQHETNNPRVPKTGRFGQRHI